MKQVLCDWDDEHAARILANVRRAAPPGSALLVIDWLRPHDDAGSPLNMNDLGLLVAVGGRLRTEDEYRILLAGAGFEVTRRIALHAARLHGAGFPDGMLYAELGGVAGEVVSTADVLHGFLRSAGFPGDRIPASAEERGKLFRTWCAARRVLILLDDVASVGQVRPPLPAAPHSVVIVTSRRGLRDLPGAHFVEVPPFGPDASLRLLGRIAGRDRVAAEPVAARRIADLCGHLPLAIRCAGVRLAMSGGRPLQMVATRLENAHRRLDELWVAGLDPRARYEESYRALAPADRSTLLLLSLLPPRRFSGVTAARLLGGAAVSVERRLAGLVDCHLLQIGGRDEEGETLYAVHDLVRSYARERFDQEFERDQPSSDGRITASSAPNGSAMTANLPHGESCAGRSTFPPPSVAR